MSTTHDKQEHIPSEMTNLMDVVAAETAIVTKATTEIVVVETAAKEIMVIKETITETTVEIIKTAETTDATATTDENNAENSTAEAAPPAVTQKRPKSQKPPKPPKRKKQKRNSAVTSKDVQRWFAVCGRCSFFLTAYQLLDTAIDLETAVSRTRGEWITLDWNHEIRNLVNKSYGNHVDTGIHYLNGRCSECSRHFVYESSEYKSSFRIALNPAIKR